MKAKLKFYGGLSLSLSFVYGGCFAVNNMLALYEDSKVCITSFFENTAPRLELLCTQETRKLTDRNCILHFNYLNQHFYYKFSPNLLKTGTSHELTTVSPPLSLEHKETVEDLD